VHLECANVSHEKILRDKIKNLKFKVTEEEAINVLLKIIDLS